MPFTQNVVRKFAILFAEFGELGGIVLKVALAMDRAGRHAVFAATDDVAAAWHGDAWLSHPAGYGTALRRGRDVLEGMLPRPVLAKDGVDL